MLCAGKLRKPGIDSCQVCCFFCIWTLIFCVKSQAVQSFGSVLHMLLFSDQCIFNSLSAVHFELYIHRANIATVTYRQICGIKRPAWKAWLLRQFVKITWKLALFFPQFLMASTLSANSNLIFTIIAKTCRESVLRFLFIPATTNVKKVHTYTIER